MYETEDNRTKIEVSLDQETVWLSIDKMAELFQRDKSVIGKHIRNIFKEGELVKDSVWAKNAYTASDGKTYNVDYYNLDVIISVGYRVKSLRGTQFRKWANEIIKSYMIQGFALDQNRFLKGRKTDQEYFRRLLEKIKLIRTSERMFYQKITDIFAECSLDYNKKSEYAKEFYATIQNKFHYAITKNTAAEIVYNRVDSEKENMGLITWKESPEGKILKSDISIAKNYLSETELKNLSNMVNIFLDIAEDNAERKIHMYMKDWIGEVDNVLKFRHYEVLDNKGRISAEDAKLKAETEYKKYKVFQDKNYISDFDKLVSETKLLGNKDNDN
ncbi:MAG TPA: cell filamentation protein Fic [Clostridiales bacterium]|nr:MAG: cell filamentation protein Fic [Clostridiales bacterium GWD2_32_19]HCC08030.1 cell filamentation protein Fic [Clostridiales bacterium]